MHGISSKNEKGADITMHFAPAMNLHHIFPRCPA